MVDIAAMMYVLLTSRYITIQGNKVPMRRQLQHHQKSVAGCSSFAQANAHPCARTQCNSKYISNRWWPRTPVVLRPAVASTIRAVKATSGSKALGRHTLPVGPRRSSRAPKGRDVAPVVVPAAVCFPLLCHALLWSTKLTLNTAARAERISASVAACNYD